MKTGLDVSINVCRSEGYAVVEHGARPLNPEKGYLITISNPAGWSDYGTTLKTFKGNYYLVRKEYSYEELYKYWHEQEGINAYFGCKLCPFIKPEGNDCGDIKPTFHDLIHMAQTLHTYCGLPDPVL